MLRFVSALVLALTLLAGAALAQGTLQDVQARGELRCGVNQRLAGFGSVDAAGEFSGFDVDFCRAVAAAVLGDANAVTFRRSLPRSASPPSSPARSTS
jgi:general L-amino acid transport system substrate-binding protein